MRNAETWLHELAVRMFAASPFDHTAGTDVTDRRIRVVDATTIQEPGSTGTDWRLHYVLQLPSLECDFFDLTDQFSGETYKRVPVQSGDIILGDRGYCHREGVAHVIEQSGDVIVRLNWNTFPLLDKDGGSIDILKRLRTLDEYNPGEWPIWFEAFDQMYNGRLCAVRKSKEAAEKSKERIRKTARKNGGSPRPETLESAEYVYVLATTDQKTLSTEAVLELYRARWQVELAFKRMKSLFEVGQVPKKNERSARSWIYAKLLAVLLIERMIHAANFFSPWGFDERKP
ncbi:hypothetical protein AKJ49_01465 [candidate division MSBL1 archaeon SCGC-AAA382A03]|uniref:Transposase IS4-like domain-containing protein n=1 Tax=candidate division MSBL1 archaeon SCGC-AAA382A03 TaxID=1698278 RepID=A0A133VF42_9EURY|nr:hypothetical protein AKJ49_01465 [candidate division MSBL1 archaeon SCGC-AAA382A03]